MLKNDVNKLEDKRLMVSYLQKKVDDTLNFTFTITKLMYTVNGAGFAFMYFI